MDASKVKTVANWPEPTTIKVLQRLLWFANFYCQFICGYSSIASPLTSLLWGNPRCLHWIEQARATFTHLKACFTTGPTSLLFEVDASSCGIGAVLSQCHGNPGKVYPCAYFCQKLTPAKANYDIGNRELLSIKEALEEWCHWLEGVRRPFLILTDHRNLEYLHNTKRLNP